MKKSKLIVPAALAVMLLSTAASVTGTVAWFSSNRSLEVSTNDFSVKSIDGNLKVVGSNPINTNAITFSNNSTSGATEIVQIATNYLLTDGSYDHANDQIYRNKYKTGETGPVAVTVGNDEADYARIIGDKHYYFAVYWTFTFTYEGGDGSNTNLYFDPTSVATATQGTAGSSASLHTYIGYRMAFCSTSTKKVWAPFKSTSDTCNYVTTSNNTIVETGTYAAGALLCGQGSSNTAFTSTAADTVQDLASVETASSSAVNCLGQFTSSTTSLAFKCVVWYEGTDPNVVETASMDKVSTTLKFFTRPSSN